MIQISFIYNIFQTQIILMLTFFRTNSFIIFSFAPNFFYTNMIFYLKSFRTSCMPKCLNESIHVYRYESMQVYKLTSWQLCKYASGQIIYQSKQVQYASVQVFPYASMQACKYTSLHVDQYASCKYAYAIIKVSNLLFLQTCGDSCQHFVSPKGKLKGDL